MTASIEEYGELLRRAYGVLHGSHEGQPVSSGPRLPGESLEEYLARSRQDNLGVLLSSLERAAPPPDLGDIHRLITEVVRHAIASDEALAAQVRAYSCGDFQQSMLHAERLGDLVAESARLDREFIAALRRLDPATREALGIDVAVGETG
ncbi:MAG TPA: hypothetical protein VNL15_00215 [Dehalococcoidia bacterium]|nr:hypothetical protein [Dehalococcoidia bacterium]